MREMLVNIPAPWSIWVWFLFVLNDGIGKLMFSEDCSRNCRWVKGDSTCCSLLAYWINDINGCPSKKHVLSWSTWSNYRQKTTLMVLETADHLSMVKDIFHDTYEQQPIVTKTVCNRSWENIHHQRSNSYNISMPRENRASPAVVGTFNSETMWQHISRYSETILHTCTTHVCNVYGMV